MLMGGQAEGQACAEPWIREPHRRELKFKVFCLIYLNDDNLGDIDTTYCSEMTIVQVVIRIASLLVMLEVELMANSFKWILSL